MTPSRGRTLWQLHHRRLRTGLPQGPARSPARAPPGPAAPAPLFRLRPEAAAARGRGGGPEALWAAAASGAARPGRRGRGADISRSGAAEPPQPPAATAGGLLRLGWEAEEAPAAAAGPAGRMFSFSTVQPQVRAGGAPARCCAWFSARRDRSPVGLAPCPGGGARKARGLRWQREEPSSCRPRSGALGVSAESSGRGPRQCGVRMKEKES